MNDPQPSPTFSANIPLNGGWLNLSTSTIDDLLSTLGKLGVTPASSNKTAPPPPEAPKPKAEKPAAPPPEAQHSAPAAGEPSAAKTQADASPEKAATDEPLEYEVLRQAVLALAAKSRDAAAAVNAALGVKTMKDLPVERRREALAAVQAKLAELQPADIREVA